MIVLVFVDREANNHRTQESRVADISTASAEIVADIEFQLISTGLHDAAFEQRILGSSILIRCGTSYQFALVIERKKPDVDVRRRTTVRRIEDMRC